MKKYLPLLLVVTSLTVAEEVSVYGDSSASYNLTSTEKHILKTQTSVSNLSSKLDEINSLVNSINSRLNGLESTYEGDSARLNSKLNELQRNGVSSDLGSNNDSTANQSDLNALKAAITKLTALVNKINSEYVSSTELEKNMQQFVTREEFEAVKKAMGVKTSSVAPTKTTETKSASIDDSSSSTVSIGEVKTAEDKAKLMSEAKKDYDAVVLDIDKIQLSYVDFSILDSIVMINNNDFSCIKEINTDKAIAEKYNFSNIYVLINKFNKKKASRGTMMKLKDIQKLSETKIQSTIEENAKYSEAAYDFLFDAEDNPFNRAVNDIVKFLD